MEKINRRSFLRNTVAVGAAGATVTAPAIASADELPVTRVHRLAGELSRAMDDWCADIGYGAEPDVWKAHVYPSRHLEYPVMFEHISPALELDDPLLDAIAAYHEQNQRFNELPADFAPYADEHEAIAATYGPADDALINWNRPATTLEGAIAALRLAQYENYWYAESEIATNMINAALAYFEQRGGAV